MTAADTGEEHEGLGARGRTPSWIFDLLVATDRGWIAVGLLALVPLGMLLAGALYPAAIEQAFQEREPVRGLHEALVIATVTGATLVLTLSQILLSSEFGPVGEQRRRSREAMEFRSQVEEVVPGGVDPPTPSNLLAALSAAILERAEVLEQAAGELADADCRAEIGAYLERLRADAQRLNSDLEEARFGTFPVIHAALDFDHPAILHETRALRGPPQTRDGDRLDEAFAELMDVLELVDTARSHVKTLYFQYELVELSRWMVFTSFPAIVMAVVSVLFFDPTAFTSAWVGLVVASVTVAVALAPFAILLAYIIRVLTLTNKTLSRGPFIVPS